MKTNNYRSLLSERSSFIIRLLIIVAFVFVLGCDSQPQLDKDPDKVEKRRQDFIQQSEREADEALPTE